MVAVPSVWGGMILELHASRGGEDSTLRMRRDDSKCVGWKVSEYMYPPYVEGWFHALYRKHSRQGVPSLDGGIIHMSPNT